MYRFVIKGTVQGVGFRPYIYNACRAQGLVGFVQNTGNGVTAEVDRKDEFITILEGIPPHITVDSYVVEEVGGVHTTFTIRESAGSGYADIPPDFSLCDDCVTELNDSTNRRFGYYFNTCTACGPRFTITKKIPYDRSSTSMGDYALCSKCLNEYSDPQNRRYHAQTIACTECGPRLSLYREDMVTSSSDSDALRQAIELITDGQIIAIKGVGGFHLACNTAPETIRALKTLTKRTDKPFAVMCKDMDMVRTIANPDATHEDFLNSPSRPIVLIPKKKGLDLVTELSTIGIMLPYTALHYLLFNNLNEPLVMTSSNYSDEPTTTTREEQSTSSVLDTTREIINVADDSVIKIIASHPLYIRRSRGVVPISFPAPKNGPIMLALGAEMQNTFSIYKSEGKIIPSQHIGNTANIATMEHAKIMVSRFLEFTQTTPELILTDLHPDYSTSQYGKILSEELKVPLVQVQHHKAHAYSVALEHNLDDFVAIVADGLGHGEDGTIWGGEIFENDVRVGHLEQQQQVGGDSATQYPAKMLFSILRNFLNFEESARYVHNHFSPSECAVLDKQKIAKFNSPLTSSCGRILDAAAFLLGFCNERTYDGRPAMLLESHSSEPFDFKPILRNTTLLTTPLFVYLVTHLHKDKRRLAATVQKYLAEGLYEIAKKYEKPIVFSGGCAYNTIMSTYMLERGVLLNKNISPGDGGISVGQIAYALKHQL